MNLDNVYQNFNWQALMCCIGGYIVVRIAPTAESYVDHASDAHGYDVVFAA
jgi:hypothetical protein